MEKRLILAITLSLLVLVSWSAFVSKTYHIDNQEVTKNTQELRPNLPAVKEELPKSPEKEPAPDSLFSFKLKKVDIIFIEPEAAIKEVIFKERLAYAFSLKHGLLLEDQSLIFSKTASDANSITFVHSDPEKTITKKYVFSDGNYDFWLSVVFRNNSASALKIDYPIVVGQIDFSDSAQAPFKDVALKDAKKVQHLNALKEINLSTIEFAGLRDRYFCAILDPENENCAAHTQKLNEKMSKLIVKPPEINLLPQQIREDKYHIYLGPQEIKELNKIKPSWAGLINYGAFDLISQMLLQLLEVIYKIVHNWGVAIIILSILVYLILYPLTLKQMRSMKEMQALQPHIEEIRTKYKDNPQRANKEIMELYRQHKVNPFGGCLPLLLQMPIFFALYQALMRSIVLKGADFLWIKDLSEPDRIFLLPFSIPFLGNEVNLLPIIMTIGMFFQQKISMVATSPGTSAEQQKLMLILFPILFGVIFYHMPAGLVLYWLVNSMLTVAYQLKMRQLK